MLQRKYSCFSIYISYYLYLHVDNLLHSFLLISSFIFNEIFDILWVFNKTLKKLYIKLFSYTLLILKLTAWEQVLKLDHVTKHWTLYSSSVIDFSFYEFTSLHLSTELTLITRHFKNQFFRDNLIWSLSYSDYNNMSADVICCFVSRCLHW